MKIKSTMVLAIGLALGSTAFAMPQAKSAAVQITDGPRVESVGTTNAVIAWTTNTGGSTVVRYGTDKNNLSQTAQAPYADNEKTASQNHRVKMSNLTPGTTYYYVVDSGQGEGTGTEAKSQVGTFTTKGTAPGGSASGSSNSGSDAAAGGSKAVRITDGPRVEGVGRDWAVVAWTTSTGGSTIVRYGTDKDSLTQTAEAPYSDNEKTQAQNHRVRIKNLKPGTTYYFVADSGQGEGTGTEAKSSVTSFTTKK